MGYTEKLSEQLVVKEIIGAVGTGSFTTTSGIVDMSDFHRLMLVVDLHETATAMTTATATSSTVTSTSMTTITCKVASLTVSISDSSAFGGTADQLTTAALGLGTGSATSWSSTYSDTVTATASTGTATGMVTATATSTASIDEHVEAEISGEVVQGHRVNEDRYVRAKIKVTGVAGAGAALILADTARHKPS